jgi:prepilin-type N-terminal cleavage/methylation domain-containing protein
MDSVEYRGHENRQVSNAVSAVLIRAFTIIELLVSIGVIGILLAILIPTLASTRARARETKCLSNLRGLGAAMELYTQRFNGKFPFAIGGQKIDTSPDHDGTRFQQIQKNFDIAINWPGLMHEVAPWREWYSTWVCPGARRKTGEPWSPPDDDPLGPSGPSYWMSDSFLARPETWSVGTAPREQLVRAVSVSDVLFPSAKVLMIDDERAHLTPKDDRDMFPVLFADAHAKIRRLSEASKPGVNVLTGSSTPLYDTLDGSRGRDY